MLVGFSYGGLVAAGVVDRIPERVSTLVYLDAFVPVSGRSMFDLMPASMRASLQRLHSPAVAGGRCRQFPWSGSAHSAPSVPEWTYRTSQSSWLVAVRIRSEPMKSRPVPGTRALQVPTVYITCGTHGDDDPMAPVVAAVRVAGIPIYVLPTGHFPMLTMPVELADLLESLLPV